MEASWPVMGALVVQEDVHFCAVHTASISSPSYVNDGIIHFKSQENDERKASLSFFLMQGPRTMDVYHQNPRSTLHLKTWTTAGLLSLPPQDISSTTTNEST